jgi:hypothetical protein
LGRLASVSAYSPKPYSWPPGEHADFSRNAAPAFGVDFLASIFSALAEIWLLVHFPKSTMSSLESVTYQQSRALGRLPATGATVSPSLESGPVSKSASELQVGEAVEIAENVGSPGKYGELSRLVDLGYGAGAAGFVGKVSEISWVQRCKEHLAPRSRPGYLQDPMETTQTQLDQHDVAANKVNYYLDDPHCHPPAIDTSCEMEN